MSDKKLGIIGAGSMGSAIATGVSKAQIYNAKNVILLDSNDDKLEKLKNDHGFTTTKSIKDFVEMQPDYIIIAVKPKDIRSLLTDLDGIKNSAALISIAAGIKLESFEEYFPDNPILRAMPNTPTQIGAGATVIAPNIAVSEKQLEEVLNIFKTLGLALVMDESKINAVTALSGSGPAYVFLMIEAMTEAAVSLGLEEEAAKDLAEMTVYGASKLVIDSKEEASNLRVKVTSPGGTTQAALESFNNSDFRTIVHNAMEAAATRAQQLS